MKDRVKIPMSSPAELCVLLNNVRTKHTTDGDASPLRVLDWDGKAVDNVLAAHENVENLKRQLKQANQERKASMKEATQFARSVRDVLAGKYPSSMKMLGQWGFTVLDVRHRSVEAPATGVAAKP